MGYYWLSEDELGFPDPELAFHDGLLAVGGDLSPQRLLLAYSQGIFPWYNELEPIMWWTPDPRLVLYPGQLVVSKTLRLFMKKSSWQFRVNSNFIKVMRSCQSVKRQNQEEGSWISEEIIEAYSLLHKMGYCHSFECWEGDKLIGGLYGVLIGKVFYGESMFASKSNSSKFAFTMAVRLLKNNGIVMIDCQQDTPHLRNFGAITIDRTEFNKVLKFNILTNGFEPTVLCEID